MSQVTEAIAFDRSQIGKPYVWGGTGPNGWDCSGLQQAACRAAGVDIPRTTYTQIGVGTPVSKAELLPGDLIFPDPGHVQMYSGNGMVIEAPATGLNVREVAMWGFWQARRVLSGGSDPGASTTTASDPTQAQLLNLGPIPTPGDLLTMVKDIWSMAKDVESVANSAQKAVLFLINPQSWLRISGGAVGAVLLWEGIRGYANIQLPSSTDIVKAIPSMSGKVANTMKTHAPTVEKVPKIPRVAVA